MKNISRFVILPYTLAVMVLMLFIECTKKETGEELLTLPLTQFVGDQLRVDGYYYRLSEDSDGNPAYEIYFLYRNGVILYGGFPLASDLISKENSFADGSYSDQARKSKTNWGRFQIIGQQIKYERWYPSSGGAAPVYMHTGEILNDSTFHITLSIPSHGNGGLRQLDHLYRFKPFAPKPDSTNSFTN